MRKRALVMFSLVLIASMLLGGCARKAKVKMGALVPLTGPLAEFGEGFRKAGDLAAKQFGEAGFPIEVKYGDTETSAIPGVEAARMLVDVEGVQVLIGAASSGVSMPIAESVSIPGEVPQISNASTSPLLTVLPADEGKDFLFTGRNQWVTLRPWKGSMLSVIGFGGSQGNPTFCGPVFLSTISYSLLFVKQI